MPFLLWNVKCMSERSFYLCVIIVSFVFHISSLTVRTNFFFQLFCMFCSFCRKENLTWHAKSLFWSYLYYNKFFFVLLCERFVWCMKISPNDVKKNIKIEWSQESCIVYLSIYPGSWYNLAVFSPIHNKNSMDHT